MSGGTSLDIGLGTREGLPEAHLPGQAQLQAVPCEVKPPIVSGSAIFQEH